MPCAQGSNGKNLTPDAKEEAVRYLHHEHGLSIHRVARNLGVNRSSLYRIKRAKDDTPVIAELERLSQKHPRNGFWKLYGRMRKAGKVWNHKRVYRIYKAMRLNLRHKGKKRLPDRIKQPLLTIDAPNIQWSMDFMNDTLYSGKRYRALNVIDEFNREFLDIELDTSLPAQRVIMALQRLIEWRGKPMSIRVDSGPEFISNALEDFCRLSDIQLVFIEKGKPQQNRRCERFNGSFRQELLDCYIFHSLSEVRRMARE